ncbi:MAG: thioredoxin domain-containing protein [Devosia sp.]|uniref:DsbA family protein n=1 Tax=Devosia sp. TaxID=1871048 RepID=UPI001ACDDFDC|nr:DsbA family protein [Devosia sp.]MBN9308483.1 thioredoxin domain-containing protein [Devosia sp.]MBN9314605.1 thioredoxin domain-containing protein [Devosia sp.]
MSRLTIALVLLVGALAGGLAVSLATRTALDETQVRTIAEDVVAAAPKTAAGLTPSAVESIVTDLIARQPKQNTPQSDQVASVDAATINPMIEDYLLKNPRILQKVSAALDAELTAERTAQTKAAIAELQPALYSAPGQVVLGNPEGDVTLVEMFDYNCGYCRQSLPDIAALLDEDKNLRIILKEFPILSQASIEAARVAVQVAEANVDYWSFHQALFTGRGQVDKAAALKAAADLGLNPITLEMGMKAPKVEDVIQQSYRIADQLKITGTPTFIIGEEVIPGAIGLDGLKQRIANMRACGATVCPAPTAQPG